MVKTPFLRIVETGKDKGLLSWENGLPIRQELKKRETAQELGE
jgi:hypothetical protein